MTAPITMAIDDGVAWLTLARPDKRNAIDQGFAETLQSMMISCATDPNVRCVVIIGDGPYFSVGGDIDAFAGASSDAERFVHKLASTFHVGLLQMATMGKPTITAINGPAAGAGLALAIAGDIALASSSAHFTAAYSAVGLTPDGGFSWWLPRMVGLRRAQEMLLTNRRIDAKEALAIGLVTRVVPDEELRDAARALSRRFAKAATAALGRCKSLLLQSSTEDLRAQLDDEAAAIAAACAGVEGREGVAAFLAKRPTQFR